MLAPGEVDGGEMSAASKVNIAGASAPWANHWIAAFNVPEGELRERGGELPARARSPTTART